jgi:GNAT superfamily N-acetyltransferase
MAVTIRQAVKADAGRVGELAVRLVRQHENYDSRRFSRLYDEAQAEWFYGGQMNAADAAVLVAELENEIVGFAYIQYEAKDYANLLETAAWLHDIYIDETARGQNAGKLLIERSAEVARELGADKLMLSVAAKNEFAREFFERSGFRETMVEMMLDLTNKQDND